jgi:hypothetical protein
VVTPKTERSTLRVVASSYGHDEKRFGVVCDIEGYPGWQLLSDVEVTPDGLRLRRLVIEPSRDVTPDSGITTRMLREIRTGALLALLRKMAEQMAPYLPSDAPDLSVNHRVGRRGRDDRFYARWAAEYAAALTRSGHPVAELSARHNLSASQVRNLVHACRKRGMLTAAPPGRPGGELTARATELLREG